LTISLKKQIKILQKELNDFKYYNEELKRKEKYCRILDLEMEVQVYEGEIIRLRNLLRQTVKEKVQKA